MALYKRGDRYWFHFQIDPSLAKTHGIKSHVQRSAKTSNKKLAERRERTYRTRLENREFGLIEHKDTPIVTFKDQSAAWLDGLRTREKPAKPATLASWENCLNKWVLPYLGKLPLSEVGNAKLKELIGKMRKAELSAKSIQNYCQVVKFVVASALDSEGIQLYPRAWNHKFAEMPTVEKHKQNRPTVTKDQILEILAGSPRRDAILFALLAGTGLRIGEALGVKASDLKDSARILEVRRSLWHGVEQKPKTENAIRDVDVAEPLATLLKEWAAGKSGYLFSTSSGRPIEQRNALRALSATNHDIGFHAFRRFRTETLRSKQAPEDLIRIWLGHSNKTITDQYAEGLRKNISWRRKWCDRVGLGFSFTPLLRETNVVPITSSRRSGRNRPLHLPLQSISARTAAAVSS